MPNPLFAKSGEEGPVTVSLKRKPKPGREKDYEAWLSGVTKEARNFDGNLGALALRPNGPGGEYVVIYRFDSYANCQIWEESAERQVWLQRLEDIVEGPPEVKRVTGLEGWFDLPEVPAHAKPSPHRMALVLIAVVFVVMLGLNATLIPAIADWPPPLRLLLIATIQVLLMTYVVMPWITRFLRGWLFKS
ncbi:MAG: antibiotic biosynthesis monooxygenase [Rhodospirillaceae bacterium]